VCVCVCVCLCVCLCVFVCVCMCVCLCILHQLEETQASIIQQLGVRERALASTWCFLGEVWRRIVTLFSLKMFCRVAVCALW
jgi:hypothetical protein